MERKLASIQRIESISPIEGADAIEVAKILGWFVVVQKGLYKPGDMIIYCEIDSVLPESNPEFEFLRPRNFRIRTIKLRGQISQGICFPLSILPEGINPEEDLDVTEALGIIKFEKPLPKAMKGKAKGYFPSFIPKTDEIRIQTIYKYLEPYLGTELYVTEKLDGMSMTTFLKERQFGVCSRNLELKEPNLEEDNDPVLDAFWEMAFKLEIKTRMLEAGLDNHALQGELCGPGIQDNRLKLKERNYFLYNVFLINEQKYASFEYFLNVASILKLSVVPITHYKFIFNHEQQELLEMADGKSFICPQAYREGLVFRSIKEMSIDKVGRFSFKCISNKYLLKFDE